MRVGDLELLAVPVDDTVKADITLERVGSRHVIVVRARKAYRDPTRLVDLPSYPQEMHADLDVRGLDRLIDGQRRPILCMVRTCLGDGLVRLCNPVGRHHLPGTDR